MRASMTNPTQVPWSATSRRGVALIMVITVLVTLVIIAVPFALSMRRGHERTTNEIARARAIAEARSLAAAIRHRLAQTHPAQETERWNAGERSVESDPMVDNLQEITLGEDFRRRVEQSWLQALDQDPSKAARLQALRARGLGPLNDDRGSIWTGVVEDANAKLNPNGASPYVLGNLMGSALLAEEVDAGAPDIPVLHVAQSPVPALTGFPPKDGTIRIDREVIHYEEFDGSVFKGCERGVLPDTPLGDNGDAETHKKNAVVIDYTAYKLATHLIAKRPGLLTPFHNLEDLRSISSWGAGGALPADRLERLLPFLTVWSRRETAEGWLAEQLVVNELPTSEDGGSPDEVEVQDLRNPTGTTAYYNPGVVTRITDGQHTGYQTVMRVGDDSGGRFDRLIALSGSAAACFGEDENVTFPGGETVIAALAPFPVNINTAPQEVLFACIANLHLRGADSDETIVTAELAWKLAERLVEERAGSLRTDSGTNLREGGPFRHSEDYGRWLERLERENTITGQQRAALYYNSVNPHDFLLGFGTAPWCYRTLDVYHVEARVAVNDGGGEHVADATIREVVEIGSDAKTTWTLESQEQFEQRLSMGSGARYAASYPFGVNFRDRRTAHIQPALRAPKAFRDGVYPSTSRDGEVGDVRLEPVRIRLPGGLVNHFDASWYTDGWYTGYDGAYNRKVEKTLRPKDKELPNVFSMAFWWRSYSDTNWTAFDCGMDKFQNRYAIFVSDGTEGQELVFRVCSSVLEEQGAEVYVPLERLGYKPENWYHIQVYCAGEDPATMALLVDGVSVGRRRGFTFLTAAVNDQEGNLQIESAEGFPRKGALLIGREVIEYEQLSGDSIRDVLRGQRGTEAKQWPKGTPVRLLGYSHPLLSDVMLGGSSLDEDLQPWSALRVETIVVDNHPVPLDGGGTGTIAGIPHDTTEFTIAPGEAFPIWDTDWDDFESFNTRGYALLGCMEANNDVEGDIKYGGWEIVYYERNGQEFQITRYQETAWQDEQEEYFLQTWDKNRGGQGEPWPCFMCPISLMGTDPGQAGDDYLDPADPTHAEILARYRPTDDPDESARLLLGLHSDIEFPEAPNPPEVIRYDSIDRQVAAPYVLFTRDREDGFKRLRDRMNMSREINVTARVDDPDNPPPAPPDETVPDAPEEDPDDPGDDTEAVDPGEPEEGSDEGDGDGTAPPESEEEMPPPDGNPPREEEPEPDSSGRGDDELPPEPEETTDEGEHVPFDSELQNEVDLDPDPGVPDWWINGDEITQVGSVDLVPDGPRSVRRAFQFRGANYQDASRAHEGMATDTPASRLMPAFRVNEWSNWPIFQPLGRNDLITLTDGDADDPVRIAVRVRWGDPRTEWAALDEFIETRIKALEDGATDGRLEHRGIPRVLKFPTGELPDDLPKEMEFGRSTISSADVVTAFLDELQIWSYGRTTLGIAIPSEGTQEGQTAGISEDDDEIRLVPLAPRAAFDNVEGFDPDCGIFMLDGEMIVYRGTRREGQNVTVLERCVRGALGTEARFHPPYAWGRFLPNLPVSYLEGGIAQDAASLPLVHVRRWPSEGLVRVVGSDNVELIHFTRRNGNDLVLPEALDLDESVRGRGLFRGRFGTDATPHDSESLVIWQPFRYWDRFAERRTEDDASFGGVHMHPESSYLEFGRRARGAYWHRVAWQENLNGSMRGDEDLRGGTGGSGDATGFLDLLVLARFSPTVPWGSDKIVDLRGNRDFTFTPDEQQGRPLDQLYVLDDPEAANRLGIESDTAEFRVYYVYRPGAFLPRDGVDGGGPSLDDVVFENTWKQTPWFRGLTVEYTTRTTPIARSIVR